MNIAKYALTLMVFCNCTYAADRGGKSHVDLEPRKMNKNIVEQEFDVSYAHGYGYALIARNGELSGKFIRTTFTTEEIIKDFHRAYDGTTKFGLKTYCICSGRLIEKGATYILEISKAKLFNEK